MPLPRTGLWLGSATSHEIEHREVRRWGDQSEGALQLTWKEARKEAAPGASLLLRCGGRRVGDVVEDDWRGGLLAHTCMAGLPLGRLAVFDVAVPGRVVMQAGHRRSSIR